MPSDLQKERVPFQHRVWDKERGRRLHVRPYPVFGVGKLDPVERLLKGRLPTSQEWEEQMDGLRDIGIRLEEEGGAVRDHEGDPLAGQVASILCCLTRLLVWRSLPYRGDDYSQGTDVVRPQDGAHAAPYQKGVRGQLCHGGVTGQLSIAVKKIPIHGVQAGQYGEQ